MTHTSPFARIDSILDPARPRLSLCEGMAALFGCGGSLGFMMLVAAGHLDLNSVSSLVMICASFAVVLMAVYGLLFVVPKEAKHEIDAECGGDVNV